jgi:uncharacterized membrane protein SpoIIM required for sporulation
LFRRVAEVLRRDPDVFAVALILVSIGVYLGMSASPQEVSQILETLKEIAKGVPKDWFSQMRFILLNNIMIAFLTWVGGVVVIGTPYVSIKSIGYSIGLLLNPWIPELAKLTALVSYAILEVTAMMFAIVAGLLIVKNVYLRLLFKKGSLLKRTLKDGITLFLYSACTLVLSATIEASLIVAQASGAFDVFILALVSGALVTSAYLFMLLKSLIA